jgi:hypothetical protein
MNFKLLFSIAALCTFANQIACINPVLTQKLFSSPLAQKYYEKYDKIHADALNRIKNEFNIGDADWNLCMNFIADLIKKDILFATYPIARSSISVNDHYLVQEAKEILIQYGIDPQKIKIIFDNDPKTIAAAVQKVEKNIIKRTLLINPDWLGKLSRQERESALRHEIMHFAFYDAVEQRFIVELLQKNGYAQKTIKNNQAVINCSRQREIRADILSIVDKPVLIKASQDLFTRLAKIFPAEQNSDLMHPSCETRAQNFAQLLVEINQPQLA